MPFQQSNYVRKSGMFRPVSSSPLHSSIQLIEPMNEQCLTVSLIRYPLMVKGTSSYKFQIPESSEKQGTFEYQVKLPDGVTCSRGIIQWKYFTGNTWGICADGTEAVGCGIQETFVNCADVQIITNTAGFGPFGVVPPVPWPKKKLSPSTKISIDPGAKTSHVVRLVIHHYCLTT